VQKQEEEIDLFFHSLKSKETRIKYSSYLKKYLEIAGIENPLSERDPRLIERQIIDFIIKMKKEDKNWGAIHNYVAMILSFYKINDVILNTTKISRFMPEQRKVKKDRGYTHEEISKMLEITDERMRVVILLLASTGMRIGAIPSLRIRNVDENKITVYENAKEECLTFITPECKNAIDSYLDMRSIYGERINDNSFLIREQFDIRDKFAIGACKGIGREVLQWKLRDIARRSNVRTKQVPIAHGFRKFFTTQLVNAKVNPEIREMLLGHKIGLASCYYRPTEEEMYQEYQKSVNNLTINEEYRLKIENDVLRQKDKNDQYIMREKLEEKDNEINSLKEQELNNAEAIAALSDKLMSIEEDMEKLKSKH
jgi:integrase